MRRHRLHPGYVYIADGNTIIWTVLSSGIAVCLWDERSHRGGMNHFLRPKSQDPMKASPLFGDVALSVLIAKLLQVGSRREDLVARLYGGACPGLIGKETVGIENARVARLILEQYEIPIAAEHIGGEKGRKILFDVDTGSVELEQRESGLLTVSRGLSLVSAASAA